MLRSPFINVEGPPTWSSNPPALPPNVYVTLQSCVSLDSPTTSRALRNSRQISSTPRALPPRVFFLTTFCNFSPGDKGSHPRVPGSPGPASSPEGALVGLGRCSKYSLHQSTTSFVEVSSTPSPLYAVLTVHCFPFVRKPDGGPEPFQSRPEVRAARIRVTVLIIKIREILQLYCRNKEESDVCSELKFNGSNV